MPWHSMYIWRPPPISTRPAKSLLLPELPLAAESLLALGLAASAVAAAAQHHGHDRCQQQHHLPRHAISRS